MENFITGYPAHEHQHRAAMRKVLGKENYEYFFDKWLEYFFTNADAKYFASLGLNCIRIPFNYRHFEDDMNPRVLKDEGFKHLDRVVDLVSKPSPARNPRPLALTDDDSVLKMGCIRYWIYIRRQEAKMATGTRTIHRRMRHFGTIRTSRTERYGFGSRLLRDTKTTAG